MSTVHVIWIMNVLTHATEWLIIVELAVAVTYSPCLARGLQDCMTQSRQMTPLDNLPDGLLQPLCTPPVAVSEQQGCRGNEEQSGNAACCGTVAEEVARGQRKAAPAVDDDLPAHALLCIQIRSLAAICDFSAAKGPGGHHQWMICRGCAARM